MMFSSNGSSQQNNGRAVHWSGVDMETYNANKTIRIPHRLRLDSQRVTYSFCPLYSIPEDQPVCGYHQMVRNEPFWDPSIVTPNETEEEVVLQENTDTFVNTTTTTNESHSDVPKRVASIERFLLEGQPATTEANNLNNKTVTGVALPELPELGPQPVQVAVKPQAPWHVQQWDNFLQALHGLDAAMQLVSEAAMLGR